MKVKKLKVFLGLMICVFALSLGLSSCDGGGGGNGGTTVRYEITGPPGIANEIMYANENNNWITINNVPLPWQMTVTVTGQFGAAAAGFQASIETTETYTGRIYRGGSVIASVTSSSGGLTVTASFLID
ncbi:MAG: MmpS family protein [Treponema sp.]|nr:MmpS family protein [Treponema sp.]